MITLVCMPFGHVFSPSLGLELLKAGLTKRGTKVRVRYFSIRFAEIVGRSFYRAVSGRSEPSLEDLVGEWIFSRALFGAQAGAEQTYVADVLRRGKTWTTNEGAPRASRRLIAQVLRARRQVDGFLDACLRDVLCDDPRVVGFTSMFQQHVASLALARRVKNARPETFIVFGGANCEGAMGAETVRQFPFVDAAVSGEGDVVFPELVRRVLAGESVMDLPGVRTREAAMAGCAQARLRTAAMVADLDTLPLPDYREYFDQFRASRFSSAWRPRLPFETSRGCWWGERMHCTFCGLNGERMAFRRKSARRALDELDRLSRRHRGCAVDVTDSILDMGYFKDFIPELAGRRPQPRLFYEVKSNLNKKQLALLRAAGIRSIQPGIESLSDPVLKLMRKGVSALQNIQLLKWCKELGISVSWNLIWGFPGEPPSEYERMATLTRLLVHLPPPESGSMLRLDRFSPNFDDADRLGFADVRPLPSYRYVYALDDDALTNLAYYFTFQYGQAQDVRRYVARLESAIRQWRRAWQACDLFSVEVGEQLLVWDLRPSSTTPLTVLVGIDRILYQACDAASDLRQLSLRLQAVDNALPTDGIAARLAPLVERGLLATDSTRYLALTIPVDTYSPPSEAISAFRHLVRSIGRRVAEGWAVSLEGWTYSGGAATQPRRRSWRRPRGPSGPTGRLTRTHFSMTGAGELLVTFTNRRGARKEPIDGHQEEGCGGRPVPTEERR